MRRLGRGRFNWRNRVLTGLIAQVLVYILVGLIFGWPAIFILAGVGLTAVFQLVVINYLEHYGLERRQRDNGCLEPASAHHSWDDDHRLSSRLLINLTHHADHHLYAGERYQRLNMVVGAGKLPFGYATSFVVVLVPSLWFQMMNPRVESLKAANPLTPA